MNRAPAVSPLLLLSLTVTVATSTSAARADLHTVGEGGQYNLLADALDAANANPGPDEVRLRPGTYSGNFELDDSTLTLSGGWNAQFTSRSTDRTLTRIVPSSLGSILRLPTLEHGTLSVIGLTLANGQADVVGAVLGGALYAALGSEAELILSNVAFTDNSGDSGGAVYLAGEGPNPRILVEDCVFERNHARNYGGGLAIDLLTVASDNEITLRRLRFVGNRLGAPAVPGVPITSAAVGPGISLLALAQAKTRLLAEDIAITGSRAMGPWIDGTGAYLATSTPGDSLVLRRWTMTDNAAEGAEAGRAAQLSLFGRKGVSVVVSDSLIARAPGSGVDLTTFEGATFRLVNLTVVDNTGDSGVRTRLGGGGAQSIANSLVLGSASPIVDGGARAIRQVAVLTGGEPQFVNRARGNYRLRKTSPAVGQGKKTPPGGLGTVDLDGKPRIKGLRVDLGAYESH